MSLVNVVFVMSNGREIKMVFTPRQHIALEKALKGNIKWLIFDDLRINVTQIATVEYR